MIRYFIIIFVGILLGLSITISFATTQVIANLGRTESTAPYLEQLMQTNENKKPAETPQPTTYKVNYVVHTKELTPGVVKRREVSFKNFSQPIYIVGDDELSKNWLRKYESRLNNLKATGFIVNVNSNASYLRLSKELGVNPIPINGKEMAEHFGIKHYPVLISQHLIEQ
jgi:integrating conjugative element protein (TIGR03765 family)